MSRVLNIQSLPAGKMERGVHWCSFNLICVPWCAASSTEHAVVSCDRSAELLLFFRLHFTGHYSIIQKNELDQGAMASAGRHWAPPVPAILIGEQPPKKHRIPCLAFQIVFYACGQIKRGWSIFGASAVYLDMHYFYCNHSEEITLNSVVPS
jgi:hypothetical protein